MSPLNTQLPLFAIRYKGEVIEDGFMVPGFFSVGVFLKVPAKVLHGEPRREKAGLLRLVTLLSTRAYMCFLDWGCTTTPNQRPPPPEGPTRSWLHTTVGERLPPISLLRWDLVAVSRFVSP